MFAQESVMEIQEENNLIQEAFEVEADEVGFCLDQKWGDYENPYENSDTALAFNLFKKGWQAAKAQAVPEGFEIGRLQDRIVELLDERQELYAQLDRTEEDSKRINFLADKNQWIANVQLPREIVERNLSSLRNAIDRAMDLAAQEPTND